MTVVQDSNSTAALTQVSSLTSSQTILAANNARKDALMFNNSTANLYLACTGTASLTAVTVELATNTASSPPMPRYQGVISGIRDAANGSARVTGYESMATKTIVLAAVNWDTLVDNAAEDATATVAVRGHRGGAGHHPDAFQRAYAGHRAIQGRRADASDNVLTSSRHSKSTTPPRSRSGAAVVSRGSSRPEEWHAACVVRTLLGRS